MILSERGERERGREGESERMGIMGGLEGRGRKMKVSNYF